MTALRDAVSELLKAQERFFDAFEDVVAKTLEEPERHAMQGSDHSAERGDRLPLMLSLFKQTQALRNCLLDAEEDEAQELAEAWVKVAAREISKQTSGNVPSHYQGKVEHSSLTVAAMADPNAGREVAAL